MLEPKSAEAIAADIFGVVIEHITEAPRHCGDGIDGACLRGECEVVAAVDKLLAFAAQETATLQQRVEALEKLRPFWAHKTTCEVRWLIPEAKAHRIGCTCGLDEAEAALHGGETSSGK